MENKSTEVKNICIGKKQKEDKNIEKIEEKP